MYPSTWVCRTVGKTLLLLALPLVFCLWWLHTPSAAPVDEFDITTLIAASIFARVMEWAVVLVVGVALGTLIVIWRWRVLLQLMALQPV